MRRGVFGRNIQNVDFEDFVFLRIWGVLRVPVRADRSVSSSEYVCCSREVQGIKEN